MNQVATSEPSSGAEQFLTFVLGGEEYGVQHGEGPPAKLYGYRKMNRSRAASSAEACSRNRKSQAFGAVRHGSPRPSAPARVAR